MEGRAVKAKVVKAKVVKAKAEAIRVRVSTVEGKERRSPAPPLLSLMMPLLQP